MSLRQLIDLPETINEEIVVDDGITYVFRGSSDANVYATSLLLSLPEQEKYAAHWKRTTGRAFDPSMVKHVLAVHSTLQPEEGEPPYDQTEIAMFAIKQGPLFLKFMGAAYKVLGLTGDEALRKTDTSPLDKAVVGNSEKPEVSPSNLTSGLSKEPGNPIQS